MTVTVYIWYPALKKSSILSAIAFQNVGHVSIQVKNVYISHRPALENNNDRIYFSEYIVQFFSRVLSLYDIDTDTKQSSKKVSNNKDHTKKFINFEPVECADSKNYSYEEECQNKERNADNIISVDGLNEEKMLKYYLTIKESKYHPFKMNCSTFIADIIRSSLDCSSKLCSFCLLRDGSLYILKVQKMFSILIFLLPLISLLYPTYSENQRFYYRKNYRFQFMSCLLLVTPLPIFLLQKIAYRLSVGGIHLINFPVWTPTLIEYFLQEINNNNNKIKVCLNKL
ncbi:hypothetical protein VB713_11795 [Anabaena cylindrica UHCC 0172]|uniref:hypothetical protein n=1 Tax=Anabaena cylindrica TaxID=1165 RepID=UPI002B20E0E4|nr:hypothetical protein [Anabaena cylindrica]MEA5551653.1 hypothetical protein [Anabaena cylindrica UHCC 0172]